MKQFVIGFKCLVLTIIFLTNTYGQIDDINVIEKKLNDWSAAFAEKNVEQALSIYSDNFLGYYPDQPDQDFKSVKDQYNHILNNKNLFVKIGVKIDEIQISGNLAFVRLVITASIKPTMAPDPAVAYDKGIQIWQKEKNGEWKLLRSSTFPFNIN